jgi:hypothetical protein
MALVAGRKRVPIPAAGKTALRIFWGVIMFEGLSDGEVYQLNRNKEVRCVLYCL